MGFFEHLEEFRRRLIVCLVAVFVTFLVCWNWAPQLFEILARPVRRVLPPGQNLSYTTLTEPFLMYFRVALFAGIIAASPVILWQLWLFVAPALYRREKRYVWPFMSATIALFLAGGWFGYHWVLPGAIKVLVLDFGHRFHPILTIEDYTGFFMAVILGLGITFELPILIFFLALFGIVDAKFLIKHIRYAILIIFVIAAIICPTPEPVGMCLFALPMLVLYMVGIAVAFLVHPTRRNAREQKKPA